MSVNFEIPVKNRFIATSTLFSTTFGAFTLGRYDFGSDPGCQNLLAFPMDPENVYLINQMSVGGIVSESDYLFSIVDYPKLIIKQSKRAEPIYQYPIPIVNYFDGVECSAFVRTDFVDETVTLSMQGMCKQLASWVGMTELQIMVSLSVYAIANADYNKMFAGPVCPVLNKDR